jgi:hypothetical protein
MASRLLSVMRAAGVGAPRRPGARAWLLLGLASQLAALVGPVPEAGAQPLYGGEHYQNELLKEARAGERLELEPLPEGKVIERIVTVPYDVFLPADPYPGFLNWFHVTTLPRVIERELLFKAGDAWSEERVEESARNLRTYLFVSVARIVACKGSAPDRVVALVVTKDTWSLRTNAEFQVVGTQLQYLDAQLTEENLIGRRKRATIDLGLNLASAYAGLQYRDPRLWGSELTLAQRGDLIWNRSSGKLEGGVAGITLQQPLYALDTPWAWIADAQYRKDVYRLFAGGELAQFVSPTTGEGIDYAMDRHTVDLQLGVTRSLGRERKRDFSLGYRALVQRFGVPAAPVQLATVRDFEAGALPRTESAGMLYAGFRTYQASHKELLDIESYAVSEDYRLGLDFSLEARVANRWLGFSSDFLQPVLDVKWTSYAADNLFVAALEAKARYQPELRSSSPWANGLVSASLRNATPRFSVFRLHTAVRGERRYNDFNHGFGALGGESSLRGYPVAYLIGANFWAANVELRTKPVAIATLHIGAAAFFDMGGASNSLSGLSPHASAGGGLRIGLPQFNREIFRIDFGVPLERVVGAEPAYFVAQYGQAF